MRYPLLALTLVLVLLPIDTEAGRRYAPYRWPAEETIVVENRMGREWNQAVAFTVASWKRAFPRLRYRIVHRPSRRCDGAPDRIVICEVAFRSDWAGLTATRKKDHTILSSVVRVSRTATGEVWQGTISLYDMQTLCHEFGHALGLSHNQHPRTSCVANGSTRLTPGPFDRQSLKLLYKRDGPRWP